MEGRKRNPAKIGMYRILFLAALAVFLYAAARLLFIFMDYQKGAAEYKGLAQFTSDAAAGKAAPEQDSHAEAEKGSSFTVDFKGLREANPDCIGWIQIKDMDINYPIMQGTDNDYYLKHTFYGEERTAASIFMDFQNHPDFSDSITFLYGHNMKDGTMFAGLNHFSDESFYKDHPGFWIYTPEADYRYDIFSCYLAGVEDAVFQCSFTDDAGYADWLRMVLKNSSYDTGIKPNTKDKTITLMTCNSAGDQYRFVVHAVLAETVPVMDHQE